MPRFDSTVANISPPQKRKFPLPYSYKPCESGFMIIDANGVETMRITFTASEMREHYPEGKTYEEALMLARHTVRLYNEQKPTETRPVQIRGRR